VKLVPVKVTMIPTAPLEGLKLVMVGAEIAVKLEELVAVPPGVVTVIVPVVAPFGVTAVIEVALFTVKLLAAVPWNLTAVAPVKLVPVSPTEVPAPPVVGEKLMMVGAGTTVKLNELVAVPPGVVTLIVPLVAPVGTVAAIVVELVTEKLVEAVPLNFTAVAPVKFVPVRVTEAPIPPLVGLKLVMVGAATKVKLEELVPVPPEVVTVMVPVVVPLATIAVIEVELFTV